MDLQRYKWRGEGYLLLKEVAKLYGESIRNRWAKVPEDSKLLLKGEEKEYFCQTNKIKSPGYRLALLRDTDEAWFFLLGIPRSEEAKTLCKELKNSSFAFFWFSAKARKIRGDLETLEAEQRSKIRRLHKLLQKADRLRKK